MSEEDWMFTEDESEPTPRACLLVPRGSAVTGKRTQRHEAGGKGEAAESRAQGTGEDPSLPYQALFVSYENEKCVVLAQRAYAPGAPIEIEWTEDPWDGLQESSGHIVGASAPAFAQARPSGARASALGGRMQGKVIGSRACEGAVMSSGMPFDSWGGASALPSGGLSEFATGKASDEGLSLMDGNMKVPAFVEMRFEVRIRLISLRKETRLQLQRDFADSSSV